MKNGMKKTIIISILLLLAGGLTSTAQNTVESIRKLYAEVHTGTGIPEEFKKKSEELKGSAARLLAMFNSINSYPF